MSDLICRKTMRRCDTSGMCSPYGGCKPPETDQDRKIIALEATVAQQAKMIEHLRGGLGNEPQLTSCAEDMSTCTLTNGDGIGYCYNRVDPDQPAAGYTAVDMANAARDGFRDGRASVVVELPPPYTVPEEPDDAIDDSYMDAYHAAQGMRHAIKQAIIAVGGSVKDE